MSFDLNFCRNNDSEFEWEAFSSWCLSQSEYFKRQSATQIWYGNETTGVYFSFEEQDESWREEQAESSELPNLVKLTFNLNFARPTFFGREAMPWVEKASKHFGLWISNPQENETPTEAETGKLIASYQSHNRRATAALLQGDVYLPIVDRARSEWFYSYNSNLPALTEKYREEYFVPKIFFCRQKASGQVLTMTTVSAGVFAIIPKTDVVALTREKRGLFGKKLQFTRIPYLQLRELLGSTAQETDEPEMFAIPEHSVTEAKLLIKKFKFPPDSEYEGIRPDQLIDFDPGKDTSGITKYEWSAQD